MNTQFQYIVELAKQYHQYADKSESLFKSLNEIPQSILEDIYTEYGDPEKKFQPVNLLRAEIARLLIEGNTVTEKLVADLKEHIRTKNKSFFKHLDRDFLQELDDYPLYNRDMFANWQKHWNVFHVFFYRGVTKDTTRLYLDQICKQLIDDLHLTDYDTHSVDFYGPSNFGAEWCWLALYPIHKHSHRDAYQFFIKIYHKSEAGRYSGSSLKNPKPNQLKTISTYEEAVSFLNEIKPELLKLNKEVRNYFKFAPGNHASEWKKFYEKGIAAISFESFELGDLSKYNSRAEINEAIGLPSDSQSNQSWNLWLFKTANIGDLIFANKGVSTCIGIGIIESNYYYEESPDGFNYCRKVNWITNKIYQYKSGTYRHYKYLFRPDTFTPTKVWEFLLKEYLRIYPELAEVFEQHKIVFNNDISESLHVAETESNFEESPEDAEPQNFWWLNANPSMWSISEYKEGDIQSYTTHNEKGNKRRIYKHFESLKPLDIIIGYESSPTRQIKAIYEVTKGLHDTEEGEQIEFVVAEKLEVPVNWNELKDIPMLQDCEVFINNQGSLFKLTEEEYDIIREVIDNKNIITEKQLQTGGFKKYSFINDPDKPFIRQEDFNQAVEILKRKKNVILQGPPGVGKTFLARKLAYEILQEEKDANIEMIQFHQSYSYEDFIQGLRPTKKGSFDIKDGIFYSFCRRAIAHTEKPFFFIIDEINRGNLSKIFGELMMLIETDKRKEKFALKLTYSEDEADRFYVPDNLYIIGTMNTADRSLAIVDYALRRRFAFITLHPEYGESFRAFLRSKGISELLAEHIISSVTKLNQKIKSDTNLGEGFQIGHSYFCTYKDDIDENRWWSEIIKFEIKPLLEEIWFDDLSQVDDIIKSLTR